MKSKALLIILLATTLITGCKKEVYVPPNIVFILADDLGYSDLGCYGAEIIEQIQIEPIK